MCALGSLWHLFSLVLLPSIIFFISLNHFFSFRPYWSLFFFHSLSHLSQSLPSFPLLLSNFSSPASLTRSSPFHFFLLFLSTAHINLVYLSLLWLTSLHPVRSPPFYYTFPLALSISSFTPPLLHSTIVNWSKCESIYRVAILQILLAAYWLTHQIRFDSLRFNKFELLGLFISETNNPIHQTTIVCHFRIMAPLSQYPKRT